MTPWDAYEASIPDPPRTRRQLQHIAKNEAIKLRAMRKVAGSRQPCCVWCAEDDIAVLQLDHVRSDGARDRKPGEAGLKIYYDVVLGRRPVDDLQVMCANCNTRKKRIDARKRVTRVGARARKCLTPA